MSCHQEYFLSNIIYLFEDITRGKISPGQNNLPALSSQQQVDTYKMRILNSLLAFFQILMFIFTSLGFITYIYYIVLIVMKRVVNFSFIIMTSLLLYILARIFLVDVTTWPNIVNDLLYRGSPYTGIYGFCFIINSSSIF